MTYADLNDARTILVNSGVIEYLRGDQHIPIARAMFRYNMSAEQAVADYLDLDAADRRALGVN